MQRLRLKEGISLSDRPPPPKELVGFWYYDVFEVVKTFEKSQYYDDSWILIKDETRMEREAIQEASITGRKTSYYCKRLEEFVKK